MPYEAKYCTRITIELGEAFRGTGTLSLLFQGRTYSPPAKQAVVSLPLVGHGALRGGCGFCGSLWTMPHLRELLSSSKQQARDGTKCSILTCCLRKPATGSFAADMGASISRCTHFLFCERETEIGGEIQRLYQLRRRSCTNPDIRYANPVSGFLPR